jgi:hypothetical protein
VFYPTFEEATNRAEDDSFILRVYPTLYARFSLAVIFVLATTATVLIAFKVCGGGSSSTCHPNIIRGIGLIPIGFLLSLLHFRFDNAYLFDDTNIYREEGRVSFCFKNPSIRYADVKGITVYQTFWGRVFNFGSIELGTAANEGNELIIKNVRAPQELAALIEAFQQLNIYSDDWKTL